MKTGSEDKLGVGNKSKCYRRPAYQRVIFLHLKAVDYLFIKSVVTHYF